MSITTYESLPPFILDVQQILADGVKTKFMYPYERNALLTLLRMLNAETVIEIGVQRGHCAELVLRHVPSIKRYIGVDVFPEYHTGLKQQQQEVASDPGSLVFADERFELLLRARGSFDLRSSQLPLCDAMLIDGDHSERAVRHDTDLATRLVRPGGFIIWHDYWPPFKNDVVKVLDDLRKNGRNIAHVPETWLAVEVN